MTVAADVVAFCVTEIDAARERLRIEVRALDLPDESVAGIALMRAIADHARFTTADCARAHGFGVSTYRSVWYKRPNHHRQIRSASARQAMPSMIVVRDHVRAHLAASLLRNRRVSANRAALEMGEQTVRTLGESLRRAGGLPPSAWRTKHTPDSTLAAWRVFLLDHHDTFARFVGPSVPARPDTDSLRRTVALMTQRLESLKAELALVEAA